MARCLALFSVTVFLVAQNSKTLTTDIKALHDMVRADILASAERMPANHLGLLRPEAHPGRSRRGLAVKLNGL